MKGPGNGRESAIRTIHGAGIEVTEIIDVTPLLFFLPYQQLLFSSFFLISNGFLSTLTSTCIVLSKFMNKQLNI